MIFGNDIDRVVALVFVSPTGHAQKLSPIIDLRVAIGMHRAVNHDRVGSLHDAVR